LDLSANVRNVNLITQYSRQQTTNNEGKRKVIEIAMYRVKHFYAL